MHLAQLGQSQRAPDHSQAPQTKQFAGFDEGADPPGASAAPNDSFACCTKPPMEDTDEAANARSIKARSTTAPVEEASASCSFLRVASQWPASTNSSASCHMAMQAPDSSSQAGCGGCCGICCCRCCCCSCCHQSEGP